MNAPILAIIVLLIVWAILFISSILYLNSFRTLKRVMRLDFREINKIELWLSCVLSLILAVVISTSVF